MKEKKFRLKNQCHICFTMLYNCSLGTAKQKKKFMISWVAAIRFVFIVLMYRIVGYFSQSSKHKSGPFFACFELIGLVVVAIVLGIEA